MPLISRYLIYITCLSSLSGCAFLLPSVEQTTIARWKDYGSTYQAFQQITPKLTQRRDLHTMGFDPYNSSNIQLLNYLDVRRIFLPNESVRLHDLPQEIQDCLRSNGDCNGYGVSFGQILRERKGNAFLDIFNFRRQTISHGWKFEGWIIMNKDLVVYKLDNGKPNISEVENKTNPLGPLQDISLPATVPLSR